MKSMILSLVASGWVGAGTGAKTADGQSVRYFVKEIVRKGEYTLPKSGEKFTIDDAKLDNWALQHGKLSEAGVKVWVPEGHTAEASKNRGWVDDVFRDGDSLKARIALVGDAVKMAATSDVSIFSPEKWTDGKGNMYDWPILHVALTPTPVLPGLKPFEPVEFSHEGRKVDVTAVMFANDKESTMNPKLLELAAALGVASEGKDESALQAEVTAKLKVISELVDAVGGEKPDEKKDAKPPVPLQEEKKVAASHDPMMLSLVGDNRSMKIDGLVSTGKITPATAEAMKKTWIGKGNSALALSMDDSGNRLFEETIAALKSGPNALNVRGGVGRKVEFAHAGGGDGDGVNKLLAHVGQKR